DSDKQVGTEHIEQNMLCFAGGVDEIYAYSFGSVGFVRVDTAKHMYEYPQNANGKPKRTFQVFVGFCQQELCGQ
ncbi:unnamed protein product, partial [Prorocentrum cordatum]